MYARTRLMSTTRITSKGLLVVTFLKIPLLIKGKHDLRAMPSQGGGGGDAVGGRGCGGGGGQPAPMIILSKHSMYASSVPLAKESHDWRAAAHASGADWTSAFCMAAVMPLWICGGGDLRVAAVLMAQSVAGDDASGWVTLGHVMLMHSTYARTRTLLTILVTLVRRSFFCPGLRSCDALSEQKLSLRGAGTLS